MIFVLVGVQLAGLKLGKGNRVTVHGISMFGLHIKELSQKKTFRGVQNIPENPEEYRIPKATEVNRKDV